MESEGSQKWNHTKRKLVLLHAIFPDLLGSQKMWRTGSINWPGAFYFYLEGKILCFMGIMQNGLTAKEFWKGT